MSDDAEVIVVGGGPAGAAAARALATRGVRVLVIERAPMPRDKVCGDLLGTDAVATLRRLDFPPSVYQGSTVLGGAVLHGPSGAMYGACGAVDSGSDGAIARARNATDGGKTAARVIMRKRLDSALLLESTRAGAVVRYERARELVRNGARAIVGVRTDENTYRARIVIGTDGWGSLVARALGTERAPDANVAYAARSYATGVRDLARRMHFFVNPARDGYAWIFPLDDGGANVGLGFIKSEGLFDLHAAFARFRAPDSPAHRYLREATFADASVWPIPIGPRTMRRTAPGAFLAGDAAFLASPLSGSGIHHALASGDAAGHFAACALAHDADAYDRYDRWIVRHIAARLHIEAFAHRTFATADSVDRFATLSRLPGAAAILSRAMLALG